ncbi:metallophosphoesterase 1-like isoform X2 [Sycon ciliatum]|uniref:metallophosphoesterase 1-like isoform X2 n=1 Tax=Sycon ciliatum TaxID=27933 RepID=UPI0031F71700
MYRQPRQQDFKFAFERYSRIFRRPGDTPLLLVAGNHDIGFHYSVTESNVQRFEEAFKTSSVKVVSIRNIPFVLLNSVGLTSDGCWLCSAMDAKLKESALALRRCSPDVPSEACIQQPVPGIRPILLQHYPLYRSSDLLCHGDDLAPNIGNQQEFRESWEVISKEATETVLSYFQPRLAFSGHTHHGCNIMHHLGTPFPTEEQTIASFSWRNRNDPNFILLTASTKDYSLDKCSPPSESLVLASYLLTILATVAFLAWPQCSRRWYGSRRVGDAWAQPQWSDYNFHWKNRKGT